MTIGMVAGLDKDDLGGPPRRASLRTVFRRLWASSSSSRVGDAGSALSERAEAAYQVLSATRPLLESGWIQNRWYATVARPEGTPSRPAGAPPAGGPALGACLVGAVVHAARGHDRAEPGPALDFLWDAWQETRGLSGTGVAGRATPPAVRTARVRDLTRWNDRPSRTREEVLALLDLATSHTIMAAVRAPREPAGAAR